MDDFGIALPDIPADLSVTVGRLLFILRLATLLQSDGFSTAEFSFAAGLSVIAFRLQSDGFYTAHSNRLQLPVQLTYKILRYYKIPLHMRYRSR